jgi:serine/threonine protein kinase
MGVVYRGIQLSVDRPVAVKVISRSYAKDPSALKRFRREARLTCQLVHPNSIRVFDYGASPEGLPYFVMELLEGHELAADIRDRGRVVPGRAVHIATQVLGSLSEAHGLGIVHRDLKPSNIFLLRTPSRRDHVKVMDFGIAKVTRGDVEVSQFTRVGTVVGSPAYMSPEQVQGTSLDGRSDLYAMGVILFEMLTGQKPFRADDAARVMIMQVEAPVPRLGTVAPDLAGKRPLDDALARLMAKRREDRPATAVEAVALLEAALDASGLRPPPLPPPREGEATLAEEVDAETVEILSQDLADDEEAPPPSDVSTTQPALDPAVVWPDAETRTLAAPPARAPLDLTVNARTPVRLSPPPPPAPASPAPVPPEPVPPEPVPPEPAPAGPPLPSPEEMPDVDTVPSWAVERSRARPVSHLGLAILGLCVVVGTLLGVAPLLGDLWRSTPEPVPPTPHLSPEPVPAPAASETALDRGRRLLEEGSLDDALVALEEARLADPLDARVHAAQGRLYYERGKLDLALQALQRAEMRDRNLPETYLVMGLLKLEKGDKDASLRAFERFLRLEGSGPQADLVRTIVKGGRPPRRVRR